MSIDDPDLHQHLVRTIDDLRHNLPGPMQGHPQFHTEDHRLRAPREGEGAHRPGDLDLCHHFDGCIAYHTHDALRD
jgi:hypothetical protein